MPLVLQGSLERLTRVQEGFRGYQGPIEAVLVSIAWK